MGLGVDLLSKYSWLKTNYGCSISHENLHKGSGFSVSRRPRSPVVPAQLTNSERAAIEYPKKQAARESNVDSASLKQQLTQMTYTTAYRSTIGSRAASAPGKSRSLGSNDAPSVAPRSTSAVGSLRPK